jgi:hypothetical protein
MWTPAFAREPRITGAAILEAASAGQAHFRPRTKNHRSRDSGSGFGAAGRLQLLNILSNFTQFIE